MTAATAAARTGARMTTTATAAARRRAGRTGYGHVKTCGRCSSGAHTRDRIRKHARLGWPKRFLTIDVKRSRPRAACLTAVRVLCIPRDSYRSAQHDLAGRYRKSNVNRAGGSTCARSVRERRDQKERGQKQKRHRQRAATVHKSLLRLKRVAGHGGFLIVRLSNEAQIIRA